MIGAPRYWSPRYWAARFWLKAGASGEPSITDLVAVYSPAIDVSAVAAVPVDFQAVHTPIVDLVGVLDLT